jgi:four helix bundle protein
MLTKSFKDLDFYKLAFKLSLELHRRTLDFPKSEQFALSSQMRRASKGICANIAEGFGKQNKSKPEFSRFLSIAQGSANEMLVWLDYCVELNYIDDVSYSEYYDGYLSVAKMLNKLSSNL